MTKEALTLALEALEAAYARLVTKCEQNIVTYNGVDVDTLTLSQEAITAIKEALAQEKALQSLHDENERLGLYKDAYAEPERESKRLQCVTCGTVYADGVPPQVAQPAVTESHKQEPTPKPNEGFEGSIRIFLKKSDGHWERLETLEQSHEYNRQQWTQRTAAVDEDTRIAWVGLTDEEINEWTPEIHVVIRSIEAKLKEKNT